MEVFVEGRDFRVTRLQVAAAVAGVGLKVTVVDGKHAVVGETPFRSLPVLRTGGGGVVGRTNTILRHLASMREDAELDGGHGGAWGQAQVDSWLEWSFRELEPAVATALGVVKVADRDRDAAAAFAKGKLPAVLAHLDAALAPVTYLASDRLTIADIAVATTVQALVAGGACPVATATLPHLARWLTTCIHAPPFAAVYGAAVAAAVVPPAAVSGAAAGGAGASSPTPATSTGLPTALTAFDTVLPGGRFTRTRVRIADLLSRGSASVGQTVTVCGWAQTVRSGAKGSLAFIALYDGSGFDALQVVCEAASTAGYEGIASSGGTHSSYRVVGKVVESPGGEQSVELKADKVEVLGRVDGAATYPMAKKGHTVEFLRELQHLRPRTRLIGAVARIRNACAYATHRFFQERGFLYVHTPIITGSDCEGAGEMFQVTTLVPEDLKKDLPRLKDGAIDYAQDFFGKPTFLTVSGQLQVEAYALAVSDVYTFGPTFRAEESHTSRHLAEFWMIEPEIAFATLEDDMALAEDYLKFCTQFVLDHCASDLAFFEKTTEKGLIARLHNVVNEPFQRLTYTEAIDLLLTPEHATKGDFKERVYWGVDLASEHERYLTEQVFKKPVILTNYPKDIKAFYMKQNPDGKTVAAMDVLVPKIGEVIGGSQREDDYGKLKTRMAEMGVAEKPLEWYMDLRRYGSVPHAGFGLGFERLVMYVTGIENIRDAIPFPRWPKNASL